MPSPPLVRRFFVDEAGDLTLFDRQRRLAVGTEGVSHCFAVGAALVHDPAGLGDRLDALRASLASDPYFGGVPSMQPSARKTALFFHAKDDAPEVRREVLRLLASERIDVFVAFRRKHAIAGEFRAYFLRTGFKRDVEEVYEQLIERLFSEQLHQAEENHIVFARRGKSERTAALGRAIAQAKSRFERKWRKGIDRPTHVTATYPHEHAGLQAVDYHLWALQRLVERREDRFYRVLEPHFRLIVDVDDTRRRGFGEYYSSRNPLTLEKLMPVTEAR